MIYLRQAHIMLHRDRQIVGHLTYLDVGGISLIGIRRDVVKGKIRFQFRDGVFLGATSGNEIK